MDGIGSIFNDVIPDDFFSLFIPDFSDGTIFDNYFQVDADASDEETTTSFLGDTIDLMLDTFSDNVGGGGGSFIGEFFGWAADGIADGFSSILKPLIMAFAPGSTGHNVANSVINELGDFASNVLGDTFTPDRDMIQDLLKNQLSGESNSLGLSTDFSTIADDLFEDLGSDLSDFKFNKLI